MDKMKLFAGMLVFGSLWGFSECLIGTWFSDIGLPSGMIMTGFFAMTFLVMSRMLFPYYGMQLGMGVVAGGLRFFNPFGGCHLCSALAIMAEGLIFELIWFGTTNLEFKHLDFLVGLVACRKFFAIALGVFSGRPPPVCGTRPHPGCGYTWCRRGPFR